MNLDPGGTLQIGIGGTTGELDVPRLFNNGTLILNRSDASTVTSNFSGSGRLVKDGTGTLTLTSTFASSGSTTIRAGALAVPAGGFLYGYGEPLAIGYSAGDSGTLQVTGGRVDPNWCDIGFAAGSEGSVSVPDGSLNPLMLVIGTSGAGTLTLNGGLLRVVGTLSQGASGTAQTGPNAGGGVYQPPAFRTASTADRRCFHRRPA